MIVILQCAARKHPDAGHMRLQDGRRVMFVADPENAPRQPNLVFARPDDTSDTGLSWWEEVARYNAKPGANPLGLLPAWRLYYNDTYALLAEQYGLENFYILSAGWGLIRSDFLTPAYDITFSASADKYKRRRPRDTYDDFRMLPAGTTAPVVFFVSKEYVRLAYRLTETIGAARHMFFNAAQAPEAPGVNLIRYVTRTRTNWQYECAKAFSAGKIGLQAISQ